MIDCHVHFWSYDAQEFPWIGPDLGPIARNMLPDDLLPAMEAQVDRIIAVQARPKMDENRFLCDLAERYRQIAGVIGWFDFNAAAEPQIVYAQDNPIVKGFRHLVQDEASPSSFLQDHNGVQQAMPAIQAAELVYEVLVQQKDLPAVVKFCSSYDKHHLVIDHLAKPVFGNADDFNYWKAQMVALRAMDHVSIKISGLATEGPPNAAPDLYQRHIDVVQDVFGPDRLVWGSDWPVSFATHDYHTLLNYWDVWTGSWNKNDRLTVEEKTPAKIYRI